MTTHHIKLSRPSHWPYVFGSFIVGALAADTSEFFWPALAVFAFYFTYPANILLHGLAKFFDTKDKFDADGNSRWQILNSVILWNLPFFVVWLADEMPGVAKLTLLVFVFLAVFNSAWPIRAKSRPFLDIIFSSVYLLPGLFAYGLLEYSLPDWRLIAAAAIGWAAVWLYSSIPAINDPKLPEKGASVRFFGPILSLLLVLVMILVAVALSYYVLKMFSLAAGLVYALLVIVTFIRSNPAKMFIGYKLLPVLNSVTIIALAAYIANIVK